jgi:hypothetical protein
MIERIDPEEAYARYLFRELSSEEMRTLADAWLNQGMFTESLNQLCWLKEPDLFDAERLFKKSLQELEIKPPSRLEAAHLLIRITLQRIVQSQIAPEKGAEFLYFIVHSQVSEDHPDEKYLGDSLGLEYLFCWLRELWDCRDGSIILHYTDLPRSEAEVKFKQHLFEASQTWLREHV